MLSVIAAAGPPPLNENPRMQEAGASSVDTYASSGELGLGHRRPLHLHGHTANGVLACRQVS